MIELIKNFVYDNMEEFLEFWTPVIMISIGVIVFVLEAFFGIKASYGRYNQKSFGFSAPLAWLLQECPSFLVPFGLLFYRGVRLFDDFDRLNTNLVLMLYFMLHYFNRSFIYTARIKSNKKVNFLENGLAFIFCTINGLQIGHYHSKFISHSLFKWNFILGSLIFFIGLMINIDSDNRLLNLRKTKEGGYSIPSGGFFEYVSAANYFGECLEWLGFALASWSLPSLAFSLFTFANIGPRAYHHHQFYKEMFGKKYPPSRKALIPFII